MRPFILLTSLALTQALSIPLSVQNTLSQISQYNPLSSSEKYLIELAPGETQLVTEEQKWALRRQGVNFFDITNTPSLGSNRVHSAATVRFPNSTSHNETVSKLLQDLDKENMHKNLETFSGFYTRYFRSDWGKQSSE